MSVARRVWHWIVGPLPQPKMPVEPVRSDEETEQEYVGRCQTYLAESKAYLAESAAYQAQNLRLADRNIRAALALMVVAAIIGLVVPIVRAMR